MNAQKTNAWLCSWTCLHNERTVGGENQWSALYHKRLGFQMSNKTFVKYSDKEEEMKVAYYITQHGGMTKAERKYKFSPPRTY